MKMSNFAGEQTLAERKESYLRAQADAKLSAKFFNNCDTIMGELIQINRLSPENLKLIFYGFKQVLSNMRITKFSVVNPGRIDSSLDGTSRITYFINQQHLFYLVNLGNGGISVGEIDRNLMDPKPLSKVALVIPSMDVVDIEDYFGYNKKKK